MIRLKAQGVTILNFNYRPDKTGEVVPPECYISGNLDEIPIYFDHDEFLVGLAKVRRDGDRLLADLEFWIENSDLAGAMAGIAQLIPCTVGVVTSRHEHMLLGMRLESIWMAYQNQDGALLPIGDRLSLVDPTEGQ